MIQNHTSFNQSSLFSQGSLLLIFGIRKGAHLSDLKAKENLSKVSCNFSNRTRTKWFALMSAHHIWVPRATHIIPPFPNRNQVFCLPKPNQSMNSVVQREKYKNQCEQIWCCNTKKCPVLTYLWFCRSKVD